MNTTSRAISALRDERVAWTPLCAESGSVLEALFLSLLKSPAPPRLTAIVNSPTFRIVFSDYHYSRRLGAVGRCEDIITVVRFNLPEQGTGTKKKKNTEKKSELSIYVGDTLAYRESNEVTGPSARSRDSTSSRWEATEWTRGRL